jgi:SPP1 gp7 family putative phage head morphogenesis protein
MPINAPTYLETATRRLRGKRIKRFPRAVKPLGLEREYIRSIKPYLEVIQRSLRLTLLANLEGIMASYDVNRPNTRGDAAGDDIKRLMEQAKFMLGRDFTEDDIRRIAQKKGIEIAEFNEKALKKGIKRVVGVDVFFSQPYLADEIALFTSQNVSLISSIGNEAFRKVETIVYNGLQQGTSFKSIRDEIELLVDPEVGNIRARANLIARDQVGKLNGQINFLRQNELGFKRYRWQTVGDERVRESHEAKDGNIYSWDEPPADTGHPGEDFQCRCWAEPIIEDLL